MTDFRQEVTREPPFSVVCGSPREAAVELLRRELSEQVKEQFREVIRAGAMNALNSVVGRMVGDMLRSHGFTEQELEVESIDAAWQELIRRAVA